MKHKATAFFLFVTIIGSISLASNEDKSIRLYSGYSYQCLTKSAPAGITNTKSYPANVDFATTLKVNNCVQAFDLKSEFKNISTKTIEDFIKPLREDLCKLVKPGSIKVAIGVDSDGKIFGMGIGANGSIEISFDCK